MILKVKNLTAGYGKRAVLEDISFDINEGEVCGIVGLNGSGKTTLIKAVANLIPHEGQCLIEDTDTKNMKANELAQKMSYIPQQSGISIDMSVRDVVLMGFNPKLKLFQNPSEDMKKRTQEALKAVGLEDRAEDNFQKLSEGQKQLVMLARTIISDTKLLLMDEPESPLDFKVRYEAMNLISKLVKTEEKSALISLHDINLAINNCDKLLLIKDKKLADILCPRTQSEEEIEKKLQNIYGSISVKSYTNKSGIKKLVMVNESEE